jgi:hypothetical protein
MVSLVIRNNCLGRNNLWPSHRSLWATVTMIGCLLYVVPSEQLPQLLEDVLLAMQQTTWVLHDGNPAILDITWCINNHITGRWIGWNRPVVWPSQSPGLTPADFSVWCLMKRSFMPNGGTWDTAEAAGTVCNVPDVFQWTTSSWGNRAELCIDCNGGPFQYLL